MLDTKERLDTAGASRPLGRTREIGDQRSDQGRPEMALVIGLVALVSMAFGFVLGLLF
jgi:hypothetical protein